MPAVTSLEIGSERCPAILPLLRCGEPSVIDTNTPALLADIPLAAPAMVVMDSGVPQ
jgi:hypothetical protein